MTTPTSAEDQGTTALFLKYNPQFWNNLAEIANQEPLALASLLGVRPDQVNVWYSKIQVVKAKAEKVKAEKIKQMLPTGTRENQ